MKRNGKTVKLLAIILVISTILSCIACSRKAEIPSSAVNSAEITEIEKTEVEKTEIETTYVEKTITEFITKEVYLEEFTVAEEEISELLVGEDQIDEVLTCKTIYIPEEHIEDFAEHSQTAQLFGKKVDIKPVLVKLAVGTGIILTLTILKKVGIDKPIFSIVAAAADGSLKFSKTGAVVGSVFGAFTGAADEIDKSGRIAAIAGFALATVGLIITAVSLVGAVPSAGTSGFGIAEGVHLAWAGVKFATTAVATTQAARQTIKAFTSTDAAEIDWNNILSPSEYTLNGSGYTDITCTLTSLKLGYVKDPDTSEYVRAEGIGFYMNAGVLSDGNGHSIPFLVDRVFHFGPENRKYQGNDHSSQGKTFVMAIYIDPDAYANAVPGTYKGTFTYDSDWTTDNGYCPGASGSIELTLVVPEHVKHTVTVNNGTGSGSYAEGANVTITANAPESGKEFKEWTGADGLTFRSGNATSPTATFTMPGKNVEVMALYKDTEYAEHTIKVNNGSADPAKAVAGTVIKLTANAAPSGKVFDKWVVNAGSVSLTNVSSSTATFTMPAGNVEVTATYKDVPAGSFVIKVNNGNGNTTSLISAPGLVVNVKANDAPAGTEFEKWEVVSGTVIFSNASSVATIFVMPAENVEITARYKSSLSVKGKTATVKYSKVKKKNQVLAVSKVLTFVDKGQGKLTYAKVSGNSKILINKTTGAITVKKKLKKKTYTVKVKVMASGDNSCNPSGWKTVTFKIKVK